MMKKKFFIHALIFIFGASSTGLPVVLHYCEMMESLSFEICEMHEQNSCCGEDDDSKIYFSNGYDLCCSTKLVDERIKDNFVNCKTEISFKVLPLVSLPVINHRLSAVTLNKFLTDASPPSLTDNHLYLTNSVLLI